MRLRKFNYFQNMLNIGKTWIACMVAMVIRIKFFETSPLSYFMMTPYFYFTILKSMYSYTKYLWIVKFSRAEVILFIFVSKLSYFPLLSMLKISKMVLFLRRRSVFSNHDDVMICC